MQHSTTRTVEIFDEASGLIHVFEDESSADDWSLGGESQPCVTRVATNGEVAAARDVLDGGPRGPHRPFRGA